MGDGLITLPSPVGAPETLRRLLAAVTGRGLAVFATIDHARAAQQAGLALRPASLVIFGSPEGGTPLMQMAPTIAIDLPLKVLIWEDGKGVTWLTYNAPSWFARRHHLTIEDFAEEALAFEDTTQDVTLRYCRLDALLEFGPRAGPLVAGMTRTLAEIVRIALRGESAQ